MNLKSNPPAASTGTHPVAPPLITDGDVISLAKHHQQNPVSSQAPAFLLAESSHELLISFLHRRAAQFPDASSAVFEYVSSLLSLINGHAASGHSCLISALLQSHLRLFTSGGIPHDHNSLSTLQQFVGLLDNVEITEVRKVIDLITSYLPQINEVEDAHILILLPKCLDLVRISNEIDKSAEYVNSVVDALINCEWSKALLIKLVEIVRDISLCIDKVRKRSFLNKFFLQMRDDVEVQDLPGLVYQFLVLATKGFSKKEVIEGILMYFGGTNKGGSIMKQVEGTVLLHVNFGVKQDPSLGQEVLSLVKLDSRAFNHFTVAVLLSIARIRRFNESAIGVLKTALLNSYKDYKSAKTCRWIFDEVKVEYLENAKVIEKAILKAVNANHYGREHIIPSIVQLGFSLLEGVEEGNQKEISRSDGLLCTEELGTQVLKCLFEVHDMSRNEIIEQCKFRILSLKPEKCFAITRLLRYLIQVHPHPLLDLAHHLKEMLDYFAFMNAKVSYHLVMVLLPLTKFSRDLQDYIILVLRKSMFKQQSSVRLAAVNVIFDLILSEKQSKKDGLFSFQESSSQASCSQQAEVPLPNRADLFQELCGLLQRCLYQQENIRENLYRGLMRLVLVDPPAANTVFDFLLSHFQRFYKEDLTNPLVLDQCVRLENGKICIEEPLDCLLFCISWVLLVQPQNKSDHLSDSWACLGFSASQENEAGRTLSREFFSNALVQIREHLRTVNLEGLLGKNQDSVSISMDEEKKRCFATLLLGIIEVVMNITVSEMEKAGAMSKLELERELSNFIEIHELVEKYVKQGHGAKKAYVRPSVSDATEKLVLGGNKLTQERTPLLAASSIHRLLKHALELWKLDHTKCSAPSQKNSQHSSGKTQAQNMRFLSSVLNMCFRQLQFFFVTENEDTLKTLIYGDIKLLGLPLLRIVYSLKSLLKSEMDLSKKEAKGKKDAEDRRENIHLALLCLKKFIEISLSATKYKSLIDDLASAQGIEDESTVAANADCDDDGKLAEGIDDQTTRCKEVLIKRILRPLLNEFLELSFFREAEILGDIVLMIGNKLPEERRNLIGSWIVRLCKRIHISNSKVAKILVFIAATLSTPPEDLFITKSIAAELLKVVGSENASPVDTSEIFPIINKSTDAAIASTLLQSLEPSIVDMDWIVARLKTYYMASQKGVSFDQIDKASPELQLEEILFSRAEAVVKVLSDFISMNLKDPQAEVLLRLAAKFYKNLARISKLQIAPKGCQQILPSLKYQRLVEITCRQLTTPIYNFVAQMQKNQQESNKTRGIASKIKRENRCIPDLIFQIEDHEKYLIQLSKITRVNLLRHAKRSTSRDFKILESVNEQNPSHDADHNSANATETNSPEGSANEREESNDDHLSIAEEDTEDEEETAVPQAKRARTSRVVQDSDEEEAAAAEA
ncbi:uncharacterized protein LOC127249554 [Andrographis paniculata]|uniref:uncharacterized protein LOC127249554 n=1 Tax=Andrographis paniculata TaxID=175694 RepID=UPI0021E7CCE8|nr:uncharacterized protein LOC127249554 [Andrographis paniculata]